MAKKEVYLDNAATTPVRKEVLREMIDYFNLYYGNPSSFHNKGKEALDAIQSARKKIAEILNCKQNEIIFCSGGTESVNFAIKGVAFANKEKGNHIITTKIEHHAVLNTCEFLERDGFNVTYLDVNKNGILDIEKLKKAITYKTILISVMYANNEIGTIQPIREIAEVAKQHEIFFHSDACQAAEYLDLNVNNLGVDLMTLNGSKIYGPKGIGILFKKENIKVEPLIHGGGQEFGLRSGTENVPYIVGFAKALELAQKEREAESKRLTELRDYFIEELLKIPGTFLNGHSNKRLPNNINISFSDVEGESIVLYLNEKGIYVSTGSACNSKNLSVSHVLKAIGIPYEIAHGSIRISLGRETTKRDINYTIRQIRKTIEKLREISPLKFAKLK